MVIESWRKVFREGFAPLLSVDALLALQRGLAGNDQRLIQGATTVPPPLMCVQDWPCEGACLIGYGMWQGDGLDTVGEVEEGFARASFECDQRMGEPAACRWLYNFWDEGPRDEVIRLLLPEIERELNLRKARAA